MSGSEVDSEGSNLVLDLLEGAPVTPYSSPSQQVPGSVGSSRMSYTEEMSLHDGNVPYLEIVTQPHNYFRFRYKTERESGTHGCLLGRSTDSSTSRTYPTVELKNYGGDAIIKCKLYEHDRDVEHPHTLHEDDIEISKQVPEKGSYTVCFRGLGIIHTAKRDLPGLLYNKREKTITKEELKKITKKGLRDECKKAAKLINLNAVRLRFSAHDSLTDKEICVPVFSETIYNMKSPETNVLKICYASRCYGKPRGGDNVILLVEKVKKGNVRINVFELDAEGHRCWETTVHLLDNNIHYQTAIRFNTPPYKDPETPEDVKVYIELQRLNDGSRSNPTPFTYAAETFHKMRKRKRHPSCSPSSYSPASSIPSVSDTSGTGLKTAILPIENEVFTRLTGPNMGTQNKLCVDNSTQTDLVTHDDQRELVMTDENTMDGFSFVNIPTVIETEENYTPAKGSTIEEYYVKMVDQDVTETFAGVENNLINNPVLGQPNVPTPVSQQARTGETTANAIDDNSDMAQLLDINFLKDYWAPYEDEDFQLQKIVPDSGRAFPVKGESATTSKADSNKELVYFKAKEGLEVKKLVKEICHLKQRKPSKWDVKVREKLDRLFDIRLSNGDTFLHMTITGHLPSFKFVVSAIHSVNMTQLLDEANHQQLTVLHLAIMHDMPDAVAYLIDKGSDPMCADKDRNTAIHHAVMCKSSLQALLDAIQKKGCKCDLNQGNYEWQTPLHLAAGHGRAHNARLLLQRGVDTRLPLDHHGRTPLHIAVQNDDKDLVDTLLEFIPVREVDVTNWLGMTALQIACSGAVRQNTLDIIKLLLDKGATPTITEGGNKPAYKMAKCNPQMWEVMKQYLSDYYIDEQSTDDHSTDSSDDDFQSADEGLDDVQAPLEEITDKLRNLEPITSSNVD